MFAGGDRYFKRRLIMKDCKGFTLIELAITVVIVGVMSVIAVNVYANFSRKAKMSEGHALIGSVSRSEKMFYSENGNLIPVNKTSYSQPLDIDVRSNRYYRHFIVFVPGIDYNADYTVVAVSDDDTIKEYAVLLHGYINGSTVSEVEDMTSQSSKVRAQLDSINNGATYNDDSENNNANGSDDDYFYGGIDNDPSYFDEFDNNNGNGNGNGNGNNGNGNNGDNGNHYGFDNSNHYGYDNGNNGNHYGNGGLDNNDNDQGGSDNNV